jgi:hypothetical protein
MPTQGYCKRGVREARKEGSSLAAALQIPLESKKKAKKPQAKKEDEPK